MASRYKEIHGAYLKVLGQKLHEPCQVSSTVPGTQPMLNQTLSLVSLSLLLLLLTPMRKWGPKKEKALPKSGLLVGSGEEIQCAPWILSPPPTWWGNGSSCSPWQAWRRTASTDVWYGKCGRALESMWFRVPRFTNEREAQRGWMASKGHTASMQTWGIQFPMHCTLLYATFLLTPLFWYGGDRSYMSKNFGRKGRD